MSSENMRIELESFVNQGLQEGWSGWPVKGPNGANDQIRRRYGVSARAAGLLFRVRTDVASSMRQVGLFARQ